MRSVVIKIYHYGLKLSSSSISNNGVTTLITCVNGTNAVFILRPYSSSTRLAEVGKFELRSPDENCYLPGQTFLHRIFGYRGVTLFPWIARVHDIDIRKQHSDGHSEAGGSADGSSLSGPESHKNKNNPNGDFAKSHKQDSSSCDNKSDKEGNNNNNNGSADPINFHRSKVKTNSATQFHPYYQVLIDTRDCPFVSNRTQTEVVTFLGHPDSSKDVHPIRGLDYVAHEDILPYTSHEERPIHHELHSRLFRYQNNSSSPSPSTPIRTTIITAPRQSKKSPSSNNLSPPTATVHNNKFAPTESLESWRNQHPWLELSRVYRETTESVRVTVIPFYLGHTLINNTSFHWWRYCVRLENFSDVSVQLRERHWKLFSQKNMLQTIKGRGVVGVEPVLSKSEPAYQYSSHINLQDKSGHMWGTFKMQREDGHTFECRIPPFSLESAIESTTTSPTSKRSS